MTTNEGLLVGELRLRGDRMSHRAADEIERLRAQVERVRELHYPLVNSTSAMYPKPLCGCDTGNYDECPTAQALETN